MVPLIGESQKVFEKENFLLIGVQVCLTDMIGKIEVSEVHDVSMTKDYEHSNICYTVKYSYQSSV